MNENNFRFLVLNREDAELHISQSRRYAVISITDANGKDAKFVNDPNRAGVTRLKFSDMDLTRTPELEKYADDEFYRPWIIPFNKDMAKQIFDFYKEFKNEVGYFLVHCEAGISRSPAVAASLSLYESGNDAYFFAKFLPNRYVYRSIIKYLEESGELEKRAREPRFT